MEPDFSGKFKKICNEYGFLILLSILAIIVMTLINTNSFVYATSINNDAGIYYNIGKGIAGGKVLYKDLYDHKGPLVFLYYALFYKAFPGKLYGAYLFDAFLYLFCGLFSYKLLRTKMDRLLSAIWTGIFLFVIIIANSSFGCPDLIAVLTEVVMMYWFYTDKLNDKKYLALLGCLTGILVCIKFTLVAFEGIFLIWYIVVNIKKKEEKMLGNLMTILGAFLIPCFISLSYLIKNGVLIDFFNIYILTNKGYAMANGGILEFVFLFILFSLFLIFLKGKDRIFWIAFTFQYVISDITYIDLYSIISVWVVVLFVAYKFQKDCKLQIKIVLLIFVVVLFSLPLLSVPQLMKETKDCEEIVAGENDIILFEVSAWIFNKQKLPPENKYFFTPNLTPDANEEMWENLYDIVSQGEPEHIYVRYDGKDLYLKNIYNNSMNEVNAILKELINNYELTDKYENGLCRWTKR